MSRSIAIIILLILSYSASSQIFTGASFVDWDQEPNYEGVTGYDENPYDNKRKTYGAEKLPANYFQITTPGQFDTLWNNLGDPEFLNRFLSPEAGDFYDLETGGNFGFMWKAAHDGTNLYVLIKKYDQARISRDNFTIIRIYTQPTSVLRHEPTFQAGVQQNDIGIKNMAYCRFLELGGARADFQNGNYGGVYATQGFSGSFGENYPSHYSLQQQNHFWDESEQIVRAMIIMPFDGALAYPADAFESWGEQIASGEGSVIAFDITGAAVTRNYTGLEYAWTSDNPMIMESNYYAGRLEILPEIKHTVSIISQPEQAGTVKGAGIYRLREKVVLEATANDEWFFSKWTLGDQLLSLKSTYAFTMPAEELIVTAHFSDKLPRMTFVAPSIDLALTAGETITQELVFSNTGENGSELIVHISSLSGKEHVTGNWLTIQPDVLEIFSEEKKTDVLINTQHLVEGIYMDTLLLMSNDPDRKRIEIPVKLSVTGIPAISVLTDEIDFGTVSTAASITRSLVISNTGTGPLELESIEVDNGAFTLSANKLTVAPMSSEQLHVTFGPHETGDYSGNLNITSNTDDNPLITIPIKGKVMDLNVTFVIADKDGGLVQGAEILIMQGDELITSVFSDSKGESNVNTLFSGSFTYKIRKYDIEVIHGNFTLTDSPVTIHPIATSLAPVILTGQYIGYWMNEPEHAQTKGYHVNSYDQKRKHYTALKLHADYFKNFTDESFNLLWEIAGEAENIDRIIAGQDNKLQFDAKWKALHDGSKLYVFLKMNDPDMLAHPYQGEFQVMVQTNQIHRHEPTFQAGLKNNNLWAMNEAYGRYLELGGGYILVQSDAPGGFSGYMGLSNQWTGMSEPNSTALRKHTHYWLKKGRNINSILVLDFDQSLSYPVNPSDMMGERMGVKEDQTISFDVNFTTQAGYSDIKYYWSSESSMGWMSNYYSGHLYISPEDITNGPRVLTLLTNSPEGGSLTGDGEYSWGEEITITATPSQGWRFVNWTENGAVVTGSTTYTFNLYHNTELVAHFTNQWAGLAVTPESIIEDLETGASVEKEISITNTGNLPLDFSISFEKVVEDKTAISYAMIDFVDEKLLPAKGEKDLPLGAPVDKAHGGPDDFGYRWSDSDDPNGPVFIWNSIAGTGQVLSSISGCDDCQQAVDLSFDFPFYGASFNKVFVDANGYLNFLNFGSSYWNQPLPSQYAPPAIIAAYWTDLCPGCNANGKVFFQNFDNMAIFQFQDVPLLSGWAGTVTFQIQIYRSGEIRLLYLNVPLNLSSHTIGIQNLDRTTGSTIAYNTSYIKNNHAIRITSAPRWITLDQQAGVLAPGETKIISMLLDASELADGIYESVIHIQSNDPENLLTTIPVTLNVTGYPDIKLYVDEINFGITGVGNQVNFPLVITNPGGAPLEITQIATDNTVFRILHDALHIPPFETRILQVSINSEEEDLFEGSLTFHTNVEEREFFSIPLKARVLKLDALFTIIHKDTPLQGVFITIRQTNNIIFTGNTGEDGMLHIENLYPGTFQYTITKENFRTEEGSFTITDQSAEINVAMTEQFVTFSITVDDDVFEMGVNEIIPLRIDASGFSNISYSIYLTNNWDWNYFEGGQFNPDITPTVNHNFQINAFSRSGMYKFLLYYNTYSPYSNGQIYTREIEIVNNNELIEITSPQSYSIYTAGANSQISWLSINVSSVNIYYSTDNEATWETIASNVTSYSSRMNYFDWKIPVDIVDMDKQCKIRIESVSDESAYGISAEFLMRIAPLKVLYPTEGTQIYAGEKLDLIIDLKTSAWLYFNVMDATGSYSVYYLQSEYRNAGIQEFSFSGTENLNPGNYRIRVYHSSSGAYFLSEVFTLLPATGLHRVSYSIDMRDAKLNGTTIFNPDLHDVYISGTFHDKWPQPGSADRYKMNHAGSKNYKITLNTPPGEMLYSFFIVPKDANPTWNYGESDTINCRIATINGAMELKHTWKNYPVYEVTLDVNPPGAGLVFGNGFKPAGHMLTVSAVANPEYIFVNWTTNTKSVFGDQKDKEFRMPASHLYLTANFASSVSVDHLTRNRTVVYPNPANSFISIKTENVVSEIRIIDNTGRVIRVYDTWQEDNIVIDVSFLAPGPYMLQIVSGKSIERIKLHIVR